MSERQFDIEAKLQALLELSKSTAEGCEHEAKSALEAAIRLAAKYGISLSSLAEKRKKYSGADWFDTGENVIIEFTEERYASIKLEKWFEFAESLGWERHKRDYHEKEGHIWMYRQPNRTPKLELRIFERPWGDIEYEVVKNPDPIIGNLQSWMNMGFDTVELGVTYEDYRDSVSRLARLLTIPTSI